MEPRYQSYDANKVGKMDVDDQIDKLFSPTRSKDPALQKMREEEPPRFRIDFNKAFKKRYNLNTIPEAKTDHSNGVQIS